MTEDAAVAVVHEKAHIDRRAPTAEHPAQIKADRKGKRPPEWRFPK